ncbi:cell wall hydrolase [Sulfitobacter aestuarii]|uniref:Cell wall hydrolase n=1 Tax=Sulfitobacter aestuarii TaxID=2161676 RepID=A0ABW5TXY4_9RHOB
MRLFRNYHLALLLALTTTFPLTAQANSQKAIDLARVETNGLKSAGGARLQQMIAQPASANATEVKFSKGWLDQQPRAEGGSQLNCLAEALYFEARGETVKGQFAVAEVILNRVKSKRFPGTLCDVINQGTGRKYQCQFTYTCDGHKEIIAEPKAFSRVSKVARAAIDGQAPKLTDGATHYHTTAVNPRWAKVFTRTTRIGQHLFYRSGVRTASN